MKKLNLLLACTALLALTFDATPVRGQISFDAFSNVGSIANPTTISWSHTNGAGADRILIVAITTEAATDVALSVSGVTYNGVTMTHVTGGRSVSTITAFDATDVWYLLNPPIGSGTIVANFPANSASAGAAGLAISLFGVKPQAPEAVATYGDGSGTGYSLPITTLTANAWLVDAINNGSGSAVLTPNAGQTTRSVLANNGVNSHSSAIATRLIASAGLTTETWTSGTASRRSLTVASFATATVPSVSLATPTNGNSFVPGTINLTSVVGTNGGFVTNVAYYYTNSGSVTFVGTSTTGPTFPVTTASLSAGSYGFYAVMTNNVGAAFSLTNVVTISAPPPVSLVLTAPANGASAVAGSTIGLTATAGGGGGTVTNVAYYYTNSGAVTFVGTSATGPTYPVTSASLVAGSYGFYAISTNTTGITNSFTNVVTLTNLPLTAVVTTPTNLQTYLTSEAYLVTATASGSGVSNVLYYVDGVQAGSGATAPYTFNASALALGSHTVYAVATNTLTAAAGYSLTNTFTVTNQQASLSFNGTSSYVTMGNVAGKGDFNSLSNFTVEFWFIRTGAGTPDVGGAGTAGLGVGGAAFGGDRAVPLVCRGDSEAEGTTQDANFYIGIVTNTAGQSVLGADIEAYAAGTSPNGTAWAAGANHPVVGANAIPTNVWTHAAVTYNCTNGTWNIYLNGTLDTTKTTNSAYLPRYDSIQHLGLGANMNSTGARGGYFAGQLDEVRIWKTVRTAAEVAANKNARIVSGAGLVARYAVDEGTGTSVFDSAGSGVAGTLTGPPVWTNNHAFIPFAVTITNPVNAQSFSAPATVAVEAAATSPNTITNVEFYKDGVLQGNDTSSPYSFGLSTLGGGAYVLTAVVQDNSGARATSAVVNITVTSSAGVTLTSPANGASYAAGSAITFSAFGTAGGNITNLSIYSTNGTLLVTTNPAAATGSISTNLLDQYPLTNAVYAVAIDNTGATAYSTTNSYSVTNVPLIATLTSPTPGQNAGQGQPVNLTAAVSGGVAPYSVQFYTNGIPANVAVVSYTTVGSYTVYASVTDAHSATVLTLTNTLNITNVPPSVVLTHPVNGAVSNTPSIINLTATASGGGGSISSVAYYYTNSGSDVFVGSSSSGPTYPVPTASLTSGSYGFYAIVTNSLGATASSATNVVSVLNVLTFQQGVNGYAGFRTAILDATVPTVTNANLAATEWHVDGSPIRHGLIRFDGIFGSGVGQIPLGSTISSATITANYDDNSDSAFAIYRMLVTWDITTATWDSFTGGISADNVEAVSVASASVSNPNANAVGTYNAWGNALTNDLAAWSGGASNYGWVVLPTSGTSGWGWGTAGGGPPILSVVFTPPPENLAVTLTSPTNGTLAGAPATINLSVIASGGTGTVSSVAYYYTNNGVETYVGTSSSGSSYPVSTASLSILGNYGFYAYMTNSLGAVTNSATNVVTVGNFPPTVALTAPANGVASCSVTNVTISANATNYNGVTNVAFYVNGGLVGNDTTAPYSVVYSMSPGAYTITAVATDNGGLSSTSAPVTITAPNCPPSAPVLIAPANGATGLSTSPNLQVLVSDPEAQNLTVTYYGRVFDAAPAPGPDFTIVAIPDTQYQVAGINGGAPAMFNAIGDWVATNRASSNIVALLGLGDCTENGDVPSEWQTATNALYRVENPTTTGLAQGVTYQVSLGNHDQGGQTGPGGTTTNFNLYFGTNHFAGKPYYGGHYGTNNNNHYILFSASGLDFIVVSLEFNDSDATGGTANSRELTNVLAWADALIKTYKDRRAILVSHGIIANNDYSGAPPPNADLTTYKQGGAIFNALANNTNMFLMLSGHHTPAPFAGRRYDTTNGHSIVNLMSDYQADGHGGSGLIRLHKFQPSLNQIQVSTFAPLYGTNYTTTNHQFTIPYDMTTSAPFLPIGTNTGVASGSTSSKTWAGLANGTKYEWYAVVSDGTNTVTGAVNTFTTALITQQPVSVTTNVGSNVTFSVTAGVAPVKYQWYFGGAPVSNATNAALSLVNVQAGNAGSYYVAVTNNYGFQTSAVVTLTVNQPPVAGADSLAAVLNTAATISEEKLLENDSDPDGGTLSIIGVNNSTNGAVVTRSLGVVTYTPVTGFVGVDQFTYLLSDGQGSVVNGVVNVTVTTSGGATPNIVSYSQPVANGPVTLVFAGIPGRTYHVQATTNVAPASAVNWINLWTTNVGSTGLFEFTDPWTPPPSSRFYRTYSP